MTRGWLLLALALVVIAATPGVARAQDQGLGTGCKKNQLSQVDPVKVEVLDRKAPDGSAVKRITLTTNVWLICDSMQVNADRVEILSDSDWATLSGHITLIQPDVRITATKAEFNRKTKLGKFYGVTGVIGVKSAGANKTMFGGGEPEMSFVADIVEKTGAESFRLEGAAITACAQPTPRWEVTGSNASFTVNKRLIMHNAMLKVKDVPLLYVPFFYYPIGKEDRSTGFLMPSYGTSSTGGFTLNNAFFWAINRSQDATISHTFFKKTGQAVGGQYRYVASSSSQGEVNFNLLDVKPGDSTLASASSSRSFDLKGSVNQGLGRQFRLIGNVSYFTSASTQTLYQQDIYTSSQQSRVVSANLSGTVHGLRTYGTYELSDTLSGETFASRHGYGPRLGLDFGPVSRNSRIYFSAPRNELAYVLRNDDLAKPESNHSMWRFDTSPRLRAPFSLKSFPALTTTTTATWHFTQWFDSQDPVTGAQLDAPISRQTLTLQADVSGPSFSRVWLPAHGGYAEKIKHLVDPFMNYAWNSPFRNRAKLVQLDGVEGYVGGTSSLTYGVRNTLLVRRRPASGAPAGSGRQQTLLSSTIQQTYYTDALAAANDTQYQTVVGLAPPGRFSSITVNVDANPTDRLSAHFRTDIDAVFRTPRTLSANGDYGGQTTRVSLGWSKQQVIPGLQGFDNPASATQWLTGRVSVRRPLGHVGGSYSFNLDVHNRKWLQQRVVGYYNSQCCGLTVDYQSHQFAGHTVGITFSLAGLGSFANPFGSFGG